MKRREMNRSSRRKTNDRKKRECDVDVRAVEEEKKGEEVRGEERKKW